MSSRRHPRKVQHDELESRDSAHADCAVQPAHFTIPLKPQDKPASFPLHFAHAVKDEYAIKYLATLGAHATPDNIALVLEHLPLDACHIATAWKSRGSLSDVVTIDLYPRARPDARKHAGSSAQLAATVASPKPQQDASVSMTTSNRTSSSTSQGECVRSPGGASHLYHVGSVCLSFDDMKRQYLLPFKHSREAPVDVLSTYGMKHDPPVPFVTIPALVDTSAPSGASAASALQLLGRRATQRRLQCLAERARAPDVRSDVVEHMQHAFYRALPLAALGLRDADDILVLHTAVVDARMTQLIQSTVQYLYHHVFVKLACVADAATQQLTVAAPAPPATARVETERLLVATVERFTALEERMARHARGRQLFIPLLLLELRVAVETAYRLQYPVSFSVTGPTMQYILLQMDNAITALLDPESHASRLSVLETTCEASAIMAAQPFQTQRRQRRLRDQFYKTSEALQLIFPQPLAGACRKILQLRGGASVAHYPMHVVAPEHSRSRSSSSSDGAAAVTTRLELLRIMERKTQSKRSHRL